MDLLKKRLCNIAKSIYKPIKVLRFGLGIFTVTKEESYFPEKERKPYFIRLYDNFRWLIRYGTPNEFYNLYGFDITDFKKDKFDDYIDNEIFIGELHRKNRIFEADSQACLLRDKFLFYKYLSCFGIHTPEVFAVYKFGKLYDAELNEIKEDFLFDKKDYFLKDIGGQCASFVKHIKTYDDFLKIKSNLNGCYIFQEALKQSELLNQLNPYAVNTLRIVTAFDGCNEPYVFSSVLRIGTNETGNVDNWAAGGIAVGISDDGRLKDTGFYKKNKKAVAHPDTGIQFKNFLIPCYSDAVSMVLNAHKVFYGIKAIGWDVAFTENGPFIIEGNDNWEISLMQACNGGLKEKWDEIK